MKDYSQPGDPWFRDEQGRRYLLTDEYAQDGGPVWIGWHAIGLAAYSVGVLIIAGLLLGPW